MVLLPHHAFVCELIPDGVLVQLLCHRIADLLVPESGVAAVLCKLAHRPVLEAAAVRSPSLRSKPNASS